MGDEVHERHGTREIWYTKIWYVGDMANGRYGTWEIAYMGDMVHGRYGTWEILYMGDMELGR